MTRSKPLSPNPQKIITMVLILFIGKHIVVLYFFILLNNSDSSLNVIRQFTLIMTL